MTSNVLPIKKHQNIRKLHTSAIMTEPGGSETVTGDFLHNASLAAEQHGCKFLFDFPAALIGGGDNNAAAIVCPDGKGFRIVFLFVESETGEIILIEADDAPTKLVNFASSYANILAALPVTKPERLQ